MSKRLDMQAFGQRIARARIRGGWTQQELAGNTGLQQAAIARLERGRQAAVRADTVMALAEGLGCTADYLLGLPSEVDETAPDAVRLQEEPSRLAAEPAAVRG